MKVIIAGSRTIADDVQIRKAIEESGFSITEVVSGAARGVDARGELWGKNNGKVVSLFPADWENQGKKAGFLRNRKMADYADALVAVWDGKSSGTRNMIHTMLRMNKPVCVLRNGTFMSKESLEKVF